MLLDRRGISQRCEPEGRAFAVMVGAGVAVEGVLAVVVVLVIAEGVRRNVEV